MNAYVSHGKEHKPFRIIKTNVNKQQYNQLYFTIDFLLSATQIESSSNYKAQNLMKLKYTFKV